MITLRSPSTATCCATDVGRSTTTTRAVFSLVPRLYRTDSVSPGPVLTNLGDGAFAKHPEYIPMLDAQTLVGRVAEPDDVGEVIATLLSDECRYLTAADLDVSGGFMV